MILARFCICFCCFFTSFIGSVQAAVTVFTASGDFSTAAQAVGMVDFTDSLDSGSMSNSTVTRTGVTISGNIAAFPNSNGVNSIDGTGYLRFRVSNRDGATPLSFSFDSPVVAFVFDTNVRSQGVNDLFTVEVGGTASGFSMPSSDVTAFRGFISDSPFTTFIVSDGGGSSDFYGIDNLVAYTAVPETGAYGMISGVLLLDFALSVRLRSPHL